MNRENRAAGGLHFMTYRATTHRMGTFKSPTAGLVDFNNDLAGPIYESIMVIWDRIFKWVPVLFFMPTLPILMPSVL